MVHYPGINKVRINNQIRAAELLVIDSSGENRGKLKLQDALALAEKEGLDLIEISPQAKPPVARIMNFDKYRYEQEKKAKKQRAKQRSTELKHVQISVREAQNDLERKARKANEFLAAGNQVEIVLRIRGRERANKDWARQRLQAFVEMIDPEHKVISPPKFGGRGMLMQVTKK